VDALILSKLKELVQRQPAELLANPRTDKEPAFEYGRLVGIMEGLKMALGVAEEALRREDDG